MDVLYTAYALQVVLRSFFPSEYYYQNVIYENPFSSILLARVSAAIGETAFISQISKYLNTASFFEDNGSLFYSNHGIVFLCVAAQIFATFGTVLKNRLCFVVEGILWTVIFGAIFKIFCDERLYAISFFLAFVICFMCSMYIPLTIMQLHNEEGEYAGSTFFGKLYYSLFVVNVSTNLVDFEQEFVWQIPYFLLGPLFSLYLSLVEDVNEYLYNVSYSYKVYMR